jgi:hypothetical protein
VTLLLFVVGWILKALSGGGAAITLLKHSHHTFKAAAAPHIESNLLLHHYPTLPYPTLSFLMLLLALHCLHLGALFANLSLTVSGANGSQSTAGGQNAVTSSAGGTYCASTRGSSVQMYCPLPDITMVFARVDGGKQLMLRDKTEGLLVNDMVLAVITEALKAVPGGYLCRVQDGEMKYMVAFHAAQVRQRDHVCFSAAAIGAAVVVVQSLLCVAVNLALCQDSTPPAQQCMLGGPPRHASARHQSMCVGLQCSWRMWLLYFSGALALAAMDFGSSVPALLSHQYPLC